MKRILFICPHTQISGGPKVIFRFADFFREFGASVAVAVHCLGDYSWMHVSQNLHVIPFDSVNFREFDIAINFCDGWPERVPIPQFLFLQGYGTQAPSKEERNMKFPWKGVVCVSEWLEEVATSFGHKNTAIIRPWVDAFFHYSGKRNLGFPVIGVIQHDSPKKGFNILLELLDFLTKEIPRFELKLISQQARISDILIKKFSNTNHILTPIDGRNQELLASTYSDCSLWLYASTQEGFGLPPLEALACGTPVLMLKNGGLDAFSYSSPLFMVSSISEMKDLSRKLLLSESLRYFRLPEYQFISSYTTQEDEARKFLAFIEDQC